MKMKIYYTYLYRTKDTLLTIENVDTQRTQSNVTRPVKIRKLEINTHNKAKKELFLEDKFIRTKRQISRQTIGKPIPPEVLYIAIKPKYTKIAINKGITAAEGKIILLSKSTTQALLLFNIKRCHILKIDSAQMYTDGIKFTYFQKRDIWCTKSIQHKYLTLLHTTSNI